MVGANTGDSGHGSSRGGTPTLVEVNTRWHLTDFAPLTDACIGYNAVEETLSAYLDPERFDALPRVPPTGEDSRYGRVVHLVSFVEGPLEQILHEEVSFLRCGNEYGDMLLPPVCVTTVYNHSLPYRCHTVALS